MAEFKESYRVGSIVEEVLLKRVQLKYPKAYLDITGIANSNWDIFVPEKNMGIEVKSDYKSFQTGNLVIEVEMNNKPSALSVTKSKYWVFVDGFRFIWIKPIEIYRYLDLKQLNKRTFIGSGDTIPKFAYLINRDDFVRYVYALDKTSGFVEIISKNEPIYFHNFSEIKINDDK